MLVLVGPRAHRGVGLVREEGDALARREDRAHVVVIAEGQLLDVAAAVHVRDVDVVVLVALAAHREHDLLRVEGEVDAVHVDFLEAGRELAEVTARRGGGEHEEPAARRVPEVVDRLAVAARDVVRAVRLDVGALHEEQRLHSGQDPVLRVAALASRHEERRDEGDEGHESTKHLFLRLLARQDWCNGRATRIRGRNQPIPS